jgi:hypothetical protein
VEVKARYRERINENRSVAAILILKRKEDKVLENLPRTLVELSYFWQDSHPY